MLDKVLNILYYITINKSNAQEVQKVRKDYVYSISFW